VEDEDTASVGDRIGVGATEGVRSGMLAGGGMEVPDSVDRRVRTS
jgi:hypothetical protein